MSQFDKFISAMFARQASELKIMGGTEPIMIVNGSATQLAPKRPTAGQVQFLISEILAEEARRELERSGSSDFVYTPAGLPPVSISVREWKGRTECTVRPNHERRHMASMLELEDELLESGGPSPAINDPGGPSAKQPSAVRQSASTDRDSSIPPVLSFGARAEVPRGPAELDLEELDVPLTGDLQKPTPSAEKVEPTVNAEPAKPLAASPLPRAASGAWAASALSGLHMDTLFRELMKRGASDLHLSSEEFPMVRKDGELVRLENYGRISPDAMRELLWPIIPGRNREQFEQENDTDFAYEIAEEARFRANLFMDRKGMGGVFRIIPSKILTAEQLGLSSAIVDLCKLSKGLVLVTGPTGSGKSTTLCAMIDWINRNRSGHIITIEDPIEFVHENKNCLVNQREVSVHTGSFKRALRAALREDPDIVLVGEMRDLETISIAIETAETGHLVFGTLHTTTAYSTVDRIIDQYPTDQQEQIRVMLSESLKGVVSQTLCKKIGGGRVAALEVLLVNKAIANLIREGKTFQIPSIMQTGRNAGMRLLNDALLELVKKGLVDPDEALVKAVEKDGIKAALKGGAPAA